MLLVASLIAYVCSISGITDRKNFGPKFQYLSVCYFCLRTRNEMDIKSAHGTLVVFLQNDAGYAKWTPTPERIRELKLAFMVRRDNHASPQSRS